MVQGYPLQPWRSTKAGVTNSWVTGMDMLKQLRALTPEDRRLLIAALGWVLAARAVLVAPGRSFLLKQHALGTLARTLPRLPPRSLSASRWAVTAVSKRVPGTVCLPWALALQGLLQQSGRDARLRIGVAQSGTVRLEAHAWVECEGHELNWNEALERFTALGRYGVAQ